MLRLGSKPMARSVARVSFLNCLSWAGDVWVVVRAWRSTMQKRRDLVVWEDGG